MSDRQTLDIYDEKATEYAQNFCSGLEPDEQLAAFLDELPEKADVLDLGCGPGRSAAIMANAGHKVLATDASAEMTRLAQKHNGVTARQESFDDISGENVHDGVWANFSLLHADRADLPRHISAIALALKPGGWFHIGMKTGDTTQRDSLGRRYTYVTAQELDDLLLDAGLAPQRVWTGEGRGLDGSMAAWIVKQARKS